MSILTNIRKNIATRLYKNTVSLPQQFLRYGNKYMTSDWSEVIMSDSDHYKGYGYAVIRNRANSISKIAMENVRTTNDEPHDYLNLIRNSSNFSEYSFWRDASTFLDLEGVFYIMVIRAIDGERVGKSLGFQILNPYNIRRVLSPDKLTVEGYVETRKGMVREIPKEMIIEIRELNPFDTDQSFAMTDAAKNSQYTLQTSGDYTRYAIKGNMNAPGILSTDVVLPDADFANFVSRVRNHTKGEPLFGNGTGAINWESMTQDIKDAAFKEVNEINRDELFSVAGVSKTIMGIEQSGTTRETAKVQKDLFTEGQALPRIQMIIDSMNLDYYLRYKNSTVKLIVDNPNASDLDAEKKEAELEKSEFELYDDMINKGYDPDKAAKYVMGNITIEDIGKPRKIPIVDLPKQELTNVNNQLSLSVVSQQQSALQNAIVNIDGRLVAGIVNKIQKKYSKTATNNINSESDLMESDIISKYEKKEYISDLAIVVATFYGIIMSLRGDESMKDRTRQLQLPGVFSLNEEIRSYIKDIAEKSSKSHIDTVTNDIFESVRASAMEGKTVEQIVSQIKKEYSNEITEQRAKTIARTETNRAFTRSQYEADKQFIKQNNLEGRVYKKWRTRSPNPCSFCQELANRPAIPFNQTFADIGDHLTVDSKQLKIGFEDVEAGTLHPNCSCEYEIIIEPAKNFIDRQLSEIENEKKKIELSKEELNKLQEEISNIIKL